MSEGQGNQGSWLTGLPTELQSNPTLTRYADLPTFAKSHLELVSKLGQPKEFTLPTDEAGLDKVFQTLRPKDAAAYELPGDNGKKFAELSHKLGLHPKQAKGLFKEMSDMQTQADSARKAERDANLQKAATELETALKGKWGAKYDQEKQTYETALKALPQELRDTLTQAGADKHPALVEAFHALGTYMKEGRYVPGSNNNGAGAASNPVAIAAERQKFFDENRAILLSGNHLDSKWIEANKKYDELNTRYAEAVMGAANKGA